MRTDVDPAARARHARQMRNRRGAARVVAQKDAHDFLRAFALDDEVVDVAFLLQDARDLQLQLRGWDINTRMLGRDGVTNSRQHVGNRISHSLTPISSQPFSYQ